MKHLRLLFVLSVSICCLRALEVEVIPPKPTEIPWWELAALDMPFEPEAAPPMPEPQPWFSFLDQTTGTWKKECGE